MTTALAATVFTGLCQKVADRHLVHQRAAALPADVLWVERAIAAAAVAQRATPGSPIPQHAWIPHLDPKAPATLRTHGLDSFGHPFGTQAADRPILLPVESLRLLDSLGLASPSR